MSAMLVIMKLLLFVTAIAVSSSKPCTNCDGNNVTCVDGVCLPRCVSGECLHCRDSRFYGKHCEQDCPDTCVNSRCQMDDTRVVCTEGCVAGKKGDNCGVNCDAACSQCERYGKDCTGRCQDPRYYGPLCRTACPSSCRGRCDKDTGECDKCDSGYNGSSEEMCLRCGPQFLYCDGQCFQCIGDNCHNSPCGTRHTYHILQVVSGILAVIVLIGSACVVVNLARRKTRCRKRKTTQSGEEATDGRDVSKSDGSGHWAHKYWEIHDKATDTDSYVSILSLNGLTCTVTSVNESDVTRKQKSTGQESPSVSTDPAAVQSDSDKTRHHWEKETMDGCFKHGGLNMNPESNLTAEGPLDTTSGGRAIQKPYLWKSSSLSDLVESRKTLVQNRCNVSLNCLSSNTQQLIRKTNSIILIERNCDLSQVYVRYLTPGKVDIQPENRP
ncbi:uncharacterized protein LOC124153040 [Haliotis rufescens]|uniref:uncharacterized protein LOC124153040 n=1 Tax=Haliotis rufescens TaxID=6454 RepID=UPI00201F57C0|nr:uncharacterized protein LOC124153040 [Haliotis rufescens]